jgi:putative ABC transport system permease protein
VHGLLTFAWKTLVSDRSKALAGTLGVAFSLILMSMQGGLYLGLMKKASVLIDDCDADLWVGKRFVDNVDLARGIPESWRNRLRGVPGVADVRPYLVGKGTATLADGRMEDVWIIGVDAETAMGGPRSFARGSFADLRRPQGLSFDTVDRSKLGQPHVGDWLEVNGLRARFVAQTDGVTGFITMPYLFTNYRNAQRLARTSPGECSYLLVRAEASSDLKVLQAALQARVPGATMFTPSEFASQSQDYWMKRTGIGVSFGASTLLGLLVGLTVVAQSLYALALDHLEEYAALKAIGADDGHVIRIIAVQSISIAAAGAVVGLTIVAAIRSLWHNPLAPVVIPVWLMAAAVSTVFAICLIASLLPYWRIRRIDPATVLTG